MKLEHSINIIKRQSKSVDSDDFFETQDSTVDILYDHYLKDKLKLYNNNTACDFSCGNYAILNKLKKLDDTLLCYGSDINNRINDDKIEISDMFDREELIYSLQTSNRDIHIVMNPPFNLLTKTLNYYLKLKNNYPNIKSLSLLHSTRSLEGQQRHQLMEEYTYPSVILNMTKRQGFNTYFNGKIDVWTPPFSCVWSIWDDDYNGYTKFKYIKG